MQHGLKALGGKTISHHSTRQAPVETGPDTTFMITETMGLDPNALIKNFIPRYVKRTSLLHTYLLNLICTPTTKISITSKSLKITIAMIASSFVWITIALAGFCLITHIQFYLTPSLMFLINSRMPSLLRFTFAAKEHIDHELDILYSGQEVHQILLKNTVSFLITAIVIYFGVKYFILCPIFFLDIHLINHILPRQFVPTSANQSLIQRLAFSLMNTTMLVVSFFGVVFYSPLRAICQYFSPMGNNFMSSIIRNILYTENVSDFVSKNLQSSFSSTLWLMGIVNIPSQFDLSYFESQFLSKDVIFQFFESIQNNILSRILTKVTTLTTSEIFQQRISSTIFQIKYAAIVIEAATYFASLVSRLEIRYSKTAKKDHTTLDKTHSSRAHIKKFSPSYLEHQSLNFQTNQITPHIQKILPFNIHDLLQTVPILAIYVPSP